MWVWMRGYVFPLATPQKCVSGGENGQIGASCGVRSREVLTRKVWKSAFHTFPQKKTSIRGEIEEVGREAGVSHNFPTILSETTGVDMWMRARRCSSHFWLADCLDQVVVL
jgi:hypothetical protein